MGDRLGRAKGHDRLLPRRLGALGEAVRLLRQSGRHALRRRLQAGRLDHPLPRISFWSIWNEPNYGYDLGPQGTGTHQSTPNSPRLYRGILDAAWSALQATGHRTRTDRILFGELTPHGENAWGVFSNMKPRHLPALALLRRLELPRAARLRGRGSGLPDHGSRLALLPRPEPGSVLRQRVRRASLRGGHRPRTSRCTYAGLSCAPAGATPTSPTCPSSRAWTARSTG